MAILIMNKIRKGCVYAMVILRLMMARLVAWALMA